MADPKKIKLYKVKEDGTLDKDSQLLPETNIEAVEGLNEELTSKIAKTDYLENYKYGKVEKIVKVPGDIEDGKTYQFFESYDMSEFDFPQSDEEFLYGSNESDVIALTPDHAIGANIHGTTYLYFDGSDGFQWYKVNLLQEPTPWPFPIEITINSSLIIEGKEDILRKVLNIPDKEQVVEVEQTLKETKEDLANWTYKKEAKQEMIYGLKNDDQYKVNFNAIDYVDILNNDLYEAYYYNSDDIDRFSAYYYTFFITCPENHYFVFDLTDTEQHGSWRNGPYMDSSEAYSPEQLADVTFTYDESKLNTSYTAFGGAAELLKNFVLNTDGSAVTELVDGTTYKINFDITNYASLFKELAFANSGSFYTDSNISFQVWGSTSYYYSLRYYINSTPYYLIPRVDEDYPGVWADDTSRYYEYTPEELADVTLTMHRSGIYYEDTLRRILTNLDGSAIAQDEEVTIITTTSLKENFDNFKNWKYEDNGVGFFDIPKWDEFNVSEEHAGGVIYDERALRSGGNVRIRFAKDSERYQIVVFDNISTIEYWIKNYDDSDNNEEANNWYYYNDSTDEHGKCDAPNLVLNEQYVIPEYIDIFNAVYGDKSITVEEKFDSLDIQPLHDKTYDYVDITSPDYGNTYTLLQNANINTTLETGEDEEVVLYANFQITDNLQSTDEVMAGDNQEVVDIEPSQIDPSLIAISHQRKDIVLKDGGWSEYYLNVYVGGYGEDYLYDIYTIYLGSEEAFINQWESTKFTSLEISYIEDYVNQSYKEYFDKFLNLGQRKRSLEEKFEDEVNKPLKDKIYDQGEPYCKPLYKPSNDTLDLIYDAGGNPNEPVVVYDDGNLSVKTFVNSWSHQLFEYYRFYIGEDIYEGSNDYEGWRHTDDNWSTQDWIDSQEALPNITFNKQYIVSEYADIFYGLILIKNSTVTLEQKNANIKNWPYEVIAAELTNGETYTFPKTFTGDEVDVSFGENLLYIDEINNIQISTWIDNSSSENKLSIGITKEEDGESVDYYYLYGSNQWYSWSEQSEDQPYSGDITFTYNEECLVNASYKDILSKFLRLTETIITVDEVVNKELKDKNYKDAGLKDIPDWDSIDITPDSNNDIQLSIYEDNNYMVGYITTLVDTATVKQFLVRDIKTNKLYTILNIGEEPTISANTWYELNITVELATYTEADVSYIKLDRQYANPSYLTIFDAVYDQAQTLEQKLDEIETLAFISEVDTNNWEATTNPTIASTYSYQATIQNNNLINSIKCEVEFELTEMLSENYAPYYECDNESGELTIFAKEIPQSNINIKVIRWIGKIITNS